ncbi:hypothetical protein EST38_g8724 [Candolleomyces aberdarensis]|uniref:SET domain-containing protein n=1 Tax=Candolleomyces aberdarensis TaxID=2316362 RepID=A0A4Q2DE34_9AGAR|nr:hypothetical protein EST38_g8724 [Candolleomyces aberdarensis]
MSTTITTTTATSSDDELAIKSDPQPRREMPLPSATAKSGSSKYEYSEFFPESWNTLSTKERLSGMRDRYVEDGPTHNAMHAGVYAALNTLLFRNGMPGTEDGEAPESLHDFSCTLKDWKDCVDEFKVFDSICEGVEIDPRKAALFGVVMGIYKVACNVAADNHTISQQLLSGGMMFLDKLRKRMLEEEDNGGSDCDEESGSDAEGPPDSEDEGQDKSKGVAKDQVIESAQGTEEVGERIFKLPIGNLEKEELPENLEENGYVRPRFLTTADKIPLRTKYGSIQDDPELIIATSVPGAPVEEEFADPDGHCVWMTNAATKAKYFANKDWPKPLPKIPTKIVVRPTDDGCGMGVFATRDIKRFEPVLIERPYMVYPRQNILTQLSPKALEELSENQIAQISLNHAEQFFQLMVEQQMTAEAREGYMSLANSHKNDGSGPVFGIVRTNGFGIEFGEVLPGLDEDYKTGYAAVARIGSRFNHSCIPDVSAPGFDPVTFTLRFTALRDIKAGSQIHVAYTSITDSKADRQKALAPYDFECACRACVNATPQSDKLRQVSYSLTQTWRSQAINIWSKDLKLTEKVLIPVLETKKRMEEEGLDVEEAGYFTFSEILHRVYKQVGNRAKEDEVGNALVRIAMGLLAAREWRTGAKVKY